MEISRRREHSEETRDCPKKRGRGKKHGKRLGKNETNKRMAGKGDEEARVRSCQKQQRNKRCPHHDERLGMSLNKHPCQIGSYSLLFSPFQSIFLLTPAGLFDSHSDTSGNSSHFARTSNRLGLLRKDACRYEMKISA